MADRGAKRVDSAGVVFAVIFMGIAAMGITGVTHWWRPSIGLWGIAALIAVIGLGLVISSLPRRRSTK